MSNKLLSLEVKSWEIKSIDDDKEEERIIKGIATNPRLDSDLDTIDPTGADFKLPIPFLWQHRPSEPIGQVVKAQVSKDGIEVEIVIPKIKEEGRLKTRIDEAWQTIKYGLVKGLSVGIWVRKSVPNNSGGRDIISWAWSELSAVTLPANPDANITDVKSTGHAPTKVVSVKVASNKEHRVIKLN